MTKQFFCGLLFPFFWLCASSQNSTYIQYGIEDGLPQSQVRAINQDSSGHLWLGTMAGISSFDGNSFSQLSKEDGLSANRINCIFQGSQLFIGSTGAVNYLNGRELNSIPLEPGLEETRILDIAESPNGTLFFATATRGLIKWDGNQFSYYDGDQGLPDSYIRSIAFDQEGQLWVGTRNGLVILDEKRDTLVKPDIDIPVLSVSQIRQTKSGGLIITTFGNGVFLIDEKEVENYTDRDGLSSSFIRCAVELNDGEFWFGSKNGLSRIKDGAIETFDESNGLPYANIKCLGTDNEGSLWLGTDGQGLLRRTGDLFENYTTKDGLVSDLVMSIDRRRDGAFMVGTYDQGISVFNGDSARSFPSNELLPSPTVWAIEEVGRHTLIGTSSGLFVDSEKGNEIILDEFSGLPGSRITAIEETANNQIILGTDNGIAWLNEDLEILKTIAEIEGERITGVRSIISLSGKSYCGSNAGIIALDENQDAKILAKIPNESLIYSLSYDSFNHIWIGSSNGLYCFDLKSSQLHSIEFATGVAAKNINFLATMGSTLYIGTNEGLYSLNLNLYAEEGKAETRHYTKFEGLSSQETNQGAVFYDEEALWFGTTSGMVKLNLDSEQVNSEKIPIEISGIDLFLENVDWQNLVDSFSVSSGLPVSPELKYNQNYLTFNYDGIYFKNPEKIRYRYMVEGVDEDWLGPTKSRSATYAYLPDGDFTFRVQAYQVDNPEVISEAGFEFAILPPFYKTLWFYILVIAMGSALVYRLYSARLQKERERREKIQLQLQSKLMELESQTLNSSMNRHFIFNALNSIQYYINMQDRKSANRYLTSFAKLIRKNLDSSQRMDTTLTEELERLELYLTLEQMRFQQKFSYDIIIDKSINTDEVMLPAMMLQPFLENSIWHGILPSEKDGQIEIHISKDEAFWEIRIDDDGVGIKTSLASKNGNHTAHASHGMDITLNRVRLYRNMTGLKYQIEGPFERQDEKGQILGTRVIIRIPKKETVPQLEGRENWIIDEHGLS